MLDEFFPLPKEWAMSFLWEHYHSVKYAPSIPIVVQLTRDMLQGKFVEICPFYTFLTCNGTFKKLFGFVGVFLQFEKVILIWTLHGDVFKPLQTFQLKWLGNNTLLNLFKNLSCGYLAAQWESTDLSCILSCKELLFAKHTSLSMWLKNRIWPRLIINCLLWAIHL